MVTFKSWCYVEMLQNFLDPRLNNLGNVWFQQDNSTAHTARESMEVLREIFPGLI